ncbi:MAG TPA: hypothetical protein VN681_02630 [Stellaceae bacterium]|nr:hypothetical protein [Stellaceae bacterium]
MSGEIGSGEVHIRLTCPHCRRQFQKTAAWINANDYVRCDFCREPFGLRSYKTKNPATPAAAATATKPATPVPAAKTTKSAERSAAAPAGKERSTPSKRKSRR